MPSIRKSLERLEPAACDHPYLAFERLISDNQVEGDGKRMHQTAVLQRNIPGKLKEAYTAGFARRYKALQDFTGGVEGAVTRFYSMPVQGRLAAGLGNASALENGLSLNHTYGLPYLPGTGLKGMASAMAHLGLEGTSWKRGTEKEGKWSGQGDDHKVMFGTMDTGAEDAAAGIVVFHDAWWDPEPEEGKPETQLPFQPDVMTPHNKDYNLNGDSWPNDWTAPNPISFVTCGGTFRLALTGPQEWVEAAFEILKMAFQHLGFGAKTQIGYGRGELEHRETREERTAREAEETRRAAEAAQRAAEEEARAVCELARRRQETQQTCDGKLVPTDPGRGLYRLEFASHKFPDQKRDDLKHLAGDAWGAISEDAKKRKERGGRVEVIFCLEDDKPVLLGLTSSLSPT